MNIDLRAIVLVAAFALSAVISFLTGRILWGTLIPLCCWIIYLLTMSLHATGWKFGPELGLPTAFAFAALLLVGGPMVIISFYGALLGSTLSKRSPKPISPSLAAIGYLGWGALAGAISLLILPQHFISTTWLRITNLFLTPLLAGFAMAKLESWRRNRQQELIRLDSFAYGFCFAFGMALVRHMWVN
jgi:hypothetical protein